MTNRGLLARIACYGAIAAAAMAVTLIAGCAPAAARRPNAIPATQLRQIPRLAEGQRVFMEHCNQCHVGGAAGVGPSLNDKRLPAFVIKFQVRHGIGRMPAFSERKVSDQQLDDLVRYLKYLRDHPEGPPRA